MSEFSLGRAKGEIEIDATKAKQGFDDATRASDKFTKNLQSHSQSLDAVGKGMVAVGVAGLAGFGLAVKSAADFEKGLSAIKAVSGATEQQMEAVRAKALQLGKDTKFSASEASSAMEELIKAGVSVEDALNGAADATVALAAAGEVALPEAATLAANAMNAFSLSAQDMPRIADLIAGAANASAIDVNEFGMSLQQSGAVAHLAGLSFDDLAVAIAEMGNAGIKGSDAGTSLKTFLQNLQPQTKKQIALFDELGITTNGMSNKFYDARGNLKSLSEVQQVLQDATKNMTAQQKQATLEMLFGSDALRAAAILSENGAAGFNDLAAAMGKVKAADVAKTRMDNFAGSMEQLKGSLETLMITVGTPFLGFLRKVVDGLTSVANAFLNLSPNAQKAIAYFALAVTTIIGALGAFTLIVSSIMRVVVAFKEFAAAIRFIAGLKMVVPLINGMRAAMVGLNAAMFANPIGLIVLAIAALIAVFAILYFKVKPIRNAIDGLWQAFQRLWDKALGFFRDIGAKAGEAVSAVRKNWDLLLPILIGPVGLAILLWRRFGDSIKEFVSGAASKVISFFKAIPGVVSGVVSTAITAFIGFLQKIPYYLGFAIGAILRFAIDGVLAFVNFGVNAGNAILNFFTQLPGTIWNFLVAAYNFMVQFTTNMVNKAIEVGTTVLTTIVAFFTQLPGTIWNFLTAAYNFAVDWASRMIDKAIELGTRFLNTAVTFFSQLPGTISNFLSNAFSAAVRFAGEMISKAREAASGFVNGLRDGLAAAPGVVGGIVDRMIDIVKGAVSRAFSAVKGLASSMWNGFKDGLGIHSPSYIEKAMFAMTDNVTGEINTLKKQVRTIQGLGGALPDMNVGSAAIAPGMVSRGSSTTTPLAPQAVATGDSVTVNAITNASAKDIVDEFTWQKRIRPRGVA